MQASEEPTEGAAAAEEPAEQHMPPQEAAIHAFLLEAFAAGTEGLMLKALDGPASGYQPSRRSESWLKIKKCALCLCSCSLPVKLQYRSLLPDLKGLTLEVLDGPASGYQPSRRSESWLKIKVRLLVTTLKKGAATRAAC